MHLFVKEGAVHVGCQKNSATARGFLSRDLLVSCFGTAGAAGILFDPVSYNVANFLTGKKSIPIALAGQLRLPKVGPEKQPAVILLHGATGPGGAGEVYEEWTRVLNNAGFATFAVDSHAGRGIVNLPADVAKVSPIVRTVDAYRALEILAKHPMIDPARIAVMGFSNGAPAALYSNVKRFQYAHAGGDAQFAAHISVHGFCFTVYREDEDLNRFSCCMAPRTIGSPSRRAEDMQTGSARRAEMFA